MSDCEDCINDIDSLIKWEDSEDAQSQSNSTPLYDKQKKIRHLENSKPVIKTFLSLSTDIVSSQNISEELKSGNFSNWKYDKPHQLLFIYHIFETLDLLNYLEVTPRKLKRFLARVFVEYNDNPFHNFAHCFCVTQMTYAIITQGSLDKRLPKINIIALIISALCHDLDHPGFNNTYQINAKTHLSVIYNNKSILENHHCSIAYHILEKPQFNILENLNESDKTFTHKALNSCILATDMGKHNEIIGNFKKISSQFSYDDPSHVDALMQMVIKAADISNEARPEEVATPWVNHLLSEFYCQSDIEKEKGMDVAPHMTRAVSLAKGQIGFIKFCVHPLFKSLCDLLTECIPLLLTPTEAALERYELENSKEQAVKRMS